MIASMSFIGAVVSSQVDDAYLITRISVATRQAGQLPGRVPKNLIPVQKPDSATLQQRDYLKQLLNANPEKSDRQIAKEAHVDRKGV